jgi:hypothetical protein
VVEGAAEADRRLEAGPAADLDFAPTRGDQPEMRDRVRRLADLVPDPEVSQDADPLRGQTAPAGLVARKVVLVEEDDSGDPEPSEVGCSGGPCGSGADDRDVGFDATRSAGSNDGAEVALRAVRPFRRPS